MTDDEAAEVVGVLSVYFPGRIPPETVAVWAFELEPYAKADAIEGVRRHARTSQHPSLRDLLSSVERARTERAQRRLREEADRRLKITPRAAPHPDDARRGAIARDLAVDLVLAGRKWTSGEFRLEVQRRLRMNSSELQVARETLQRKEARAMSTPREGDVDRNKPLDSGAPETPVR